MIKELSPSNSFSDVFFLFLPDSKPSPSKERLISKIGTSLLNSPNSKPINLRSLRLPTPGSLCGFKSQKKFEIIAPRGDVRIEQYSSKKKSHGLFFEKGRVVWSSVTKAISSETKREDENYSTYIQYDKTKIKEDGRDFRVKKDNCHGKVNYQGSHLIDHKFSAKNSKGENSHCKEENYIPTVYFYNSPLKEYLVNRCDYFMEGALYTSSPPEIGVKKKEGIEKDTYHAIPIGIIFVQIKKIKDGFDKEIYYFPNDNFDYEVLNEKMKKRKIKPASGGIVPYFKLKKSLHELLRPAIITDFESVKEGESKQIRREEKFFDTIDMISDGILDECDYTSDVLDLTSAAVNEDYIDPLLYFDWTKDEIGVLDDDTLEDSLRALGKYLVQYSIKNTLKSEVVSLNSRFVLVNVVIGSMENYYYYDESSFPLDFFESLAGEFLSTLDELDKVAHTMNEKELLILANTYRRLTDPSMYALSGEGFAIYKDVEFGDYYKRLIKPLKILLENHRVESLVGKSGWHLLYLVREAYNILNHLEEWYEDDWFKNEQDVLRALCKPCLKLLENQPKKEEKITIDFPLNLKQKRTIEIDVFEMQTLLERIEYLYTEEN